MNQHQRIDLTTGSVGQQLFRLSAPMFFGLFAIFFFGVTDAFFLGKLGPKPLAALGFALPIMAVFMSISRGMSEGAISVISRKIGSQDMEDAKVCSTVILGFSILLVGVFVLLGWASMRHVLVFLGAEGEVLVLATAYMRIWFAGMVFLVIPIVGNGFIRAAGDTRWPAMLMVFAAIANIALDPLFIFGWGLVPAMGMKGAAVASITARSFTLLASLYLVHYKYNLLCFHSISWSKTKSVIQQFGSVSIPASLNFLIIPVTIALITKLMATYSSHHVAGFGVAHQIETLSLLFFYAIAVGMSSFVGQNVGARQRQRLMRAFELSSRVCLILGAGLTAVFLMFAQPIVLLFQDEPGIVNIATVYLMVVSFSYGCEGIYLFSVNTLNVSGKALYATWLVVFRMLVLYIPLAYVLESSMGHFAVFFAACISNVLAGALGRFLIHRHVVQPMPS